MSSFQKAKDVLKKYNQEHLLYFYDELDKSQKKFLINQICDINFKQIFDLYEASKTDEEISVNDIEPLSYIDKSKLSDNDLDKYINIGEKYIRDKEFAVVTMAGGQRNKTWF